MDAAARHDEGPSAHLRHHWPADGSRAAHQSGRREEIPLLPAGSRADQAQGTALHEHDVRYGLYSRSYEALPEERAYGRGSFILYNYT